MIDKVFSLAELATVCGGTCIGDKDARVHGVCAAETPVAGHLAFVGSAALAKRLTFDDEAVYIVKPTLASRVKNGISHEQPQKAFRQLLLALTDRPRSAKISDTAIISAKAQLGEGVSVGEHSAIQDDVMIGDNCTIGCGVVIESGTQIGAGTRIEHRVVIHSDTRIGRDCVIHAGAVIGGQGFGFSFEESGWEAIPQIGRVVLGNRVHVGANACIDRGAINDTVIGNNAIIDNLVHIAHNVSVGDGTAMAAQVGIAGSTKIGKHCLLAGQVGVVGHIAIADQVQVNGGAKVLQSIAKSGAYSGSFDVQPSRQWNRATVYFKKIDQLFKREK